jgi:uncharacterized protein YdiU (UPF0061 family)
MNHSANNASAVDSVGWNLEYSYANLPSLFYNYCQPTPVRQPLAAIINHSLAVDLGLDPQLLQSKSQVEILAGNSLPKGAKPLAQAYAGHQFGGFTILGDGRAILMGEQVGPDRQRWDVQWKGSGPTVYSRGGDGRAALGPMLREYIISHAMHSLGIPTSQGLAVISTGQPVYRSQTELGAVLVRVADSHIRVGTFQFAAARGDRESVRALADYTIGRHYPNVLQSARPYLALLQEVVRRQARLIAQWMSVGFIHGVMNTDNMSIAGQTIDYGPCAYMNIYHLQTVFSSIDHNGRYSYGNQPGIAQWNLARLAETLLPLIDDVQTTAVELATEVVEQFAHDYREQWLQCFAGKLGIPQAAALVGSERVSSLIDRLLDLMQAEQLDFTNTFRQLSGQTSAAVARPVAKAPSVDFQSWQADWHQFLNSAGVALPEAQAEMRKLNPAVIPRNHLVEQALAAACQDGDLQPMSRLIEVLADPFVDRPHPDVYFLPPADGDAGYQTFCGT